MNVLNLISVFIEKFYWLYSFCSLYLESTGTILQMFEMQYSTF